MADITSPLQLGHWQLYERLGEDILLERMHVIPAPAQEPSSFTGAAPAILTRLATPVVGDVTLQSLLRQEAQLLHALSHPSLVPVVERLETPQGPMLVQALPGGVTLASLVAAAGGRLPAPQVAELLRQLAELCESLIVQARAQGVTPLPAVLYLSPENICIDLYGDVKLLLPGSLLFPLLQQPEWKARVRSGICDVPELSHTAGPSAASTQYQLATLAFNLLTGMSLTLEVEALARELSQARTTGQHGLEAARRALPARLYESLGQTPPGIINILSRLLAFEPTQRFASLPEAAESLLREGWSVEEGGDPLQALRQQVSALQQPEGFGAEEHSQTMPALAFMPSFLDEPQADPTVTSTEQRAAEGDGQLNFSALELGGSLLDAPSALFDQTGPAPLYHEATSQTAAVPELSQSGTFGVTGLLEVDEEAAAGPIFGGAASNAFSAAPTQPPPTQPPSKGEGRPSAGAGGSSGDASLKTGKVDPSKGKSHAGTGAPASSEQPKAAASSRRRVLLITAALMVIVGLGGMIVLRSQAPAPPGAQTSAQAEPAQAEPGQAEPGQAEPGQAEPGQESGSVAAPGDGGGEAGAAGVAAGDASGGMISAGGAGAGSEQAGASGASGAAPGSVEVGATGGAGSSAPVTPLPPLPDEDAPPVTSLQSSGRLPKEILKPFNGRRRPGNIELTIDTSPPDSVVVIDGQDLHRTPISIEGLSAGEHQLIFRNEEYGVRDVVVIDVRSGEHFSGTWSYQSKKWLPLD